MQYKSTIDYTELGKHKGHLIHWKMLGNKSLKVKGINGKIQVSQFQKEDKRMTKVKFWKSSKTMIRSLHCKSA